MKKYLIVYVILFALTLIIPAIVCFTGNSSEEADKLPTIFHQCITLIGYYR